MDGGSGRLKPTSSSAAWIDCSHGSTDELHGESVAAQANELHSGDDELDGYGRMPMDQLTGVLH
ncbi:hypothetical protein E2562_024097 [Oryza meyeriana var. granulata]|uniref:Uncharacterized protein n=1 Tax=Oryza meyeriana var. granulata TaxID=110450 RepID=A0A6G1CI05_9ORYZ|nr:hypothetical protein E2562_024097 [Oryza meyeriana var. granulata]